MQKVESINSANVDQETIDALKELLAKAESGELDSVIFIDKYRDGKVGFGWSGAPDSKMIGKVEEMKFAYHAEMLLKLEGE